MMASIPHRPQLDRARFILSCLCLLPLCFSGLVNTAQAQVKPVNVRVPNQTAWLGQYVPFFVALRANGSFDGTASFDLPQIPGAIVIKIGTPVVSSEEIDDADWFVQTHEFAVFSQRPGVLKFPEFAVRFSHREGFVGEASDHQGIVPEFEVKIQRPPGTEKIGFLVTTESYTLEENWDPAPGPAKVGDIFKRTITQRASQLSGMALSPASTKIPDGIRIYTSDAETQDQIQRGDFIGNRSETITYLLMEPGQVTLPAVTYVWWNPKSKELQSETLPAVAFEVAAAPVENIVDEAAAANQLHWGWILFAGAMLFTTAVISLYWQSILALLRGYSLRLNPPDRVAARSLMQACRTNEVNAAQKAWLIWRNTQPAGFQLTTELMSAVSDMESHLFSNRKQGNWKDDWKGDQLSSAFRNQSAAEPTMVRLAGRRLPKLNP